MKKQPIEERDWMTVDEVAQDTAVSKSTVLAWIRAGKIQAQRVSTRILRIPKAEVEALKRSWTTETE